MSIVGDIGVALAALLAISELAHLVFFGSCS
jgi:hypothetical protein